MFDVKNVHGHSSLFFTIYMQKCINSTMSITQVFL